MNHHNQLPCPLAYLFDIFYQVSAGLKNEVVQVSLPVGAQ
jgi:hypothetical protein